MVKLVKLFVALAFLHFNVQGGEISIVFDSTEFDFGTVESSAGRLHHSFRFLNSGAAPVTLSAPVPGCSCISASLSAREVLPGQTGSVDVTLDLTGMSGYAARTVGVFSSGGEELATLSLSALVRGAYDEIDALCPVALSPSLRASRRDIPFGYVYPREAAVKTIRVANVSGRPLPLAVSCDNPALRVSAPGLLVPGETATVSLEYSFSVEKRGACRDTVAVDAGGERSFLTASCIRLCAEAGTSREHPALRTYPSEARLRRRLLSSQYSGTVELHNDGAAPLVIYEVCGDAWTNLRSGTTVAPGTAVMVELRTKAGTGKLEIFTNDPIRPYKELIYKH